MAVLGLLSDLQLALTLLDADAYIIIQAPHERGTVGNILLYNCQNPTHPAPITLHHSHYSPLHHLLTGIYIASPLLRPNLQNICALVTGTFIERQQLGAGSR